MGGGNVVCSAFKFKSGQMIVVALLLMAGCFYAGTLLGNNAPIYASQLSISSSSSPGLFSLPLSLSLSLFFRPMKVLCMHFRNTFDFGRIKS